MRWRQWMGWAAAVCVGAAAYGQLRERPQAPAPGTFRVTSWPEHKSADADYIDEVETYLNKMAADGWRFHSEAVGQYGKMMVFERSTGK